MADCERNGSDFLGCSLPANPQLLAEGWQRRFMADARQAEESAATYEQLGYEVRLEPVPAALLKQECQGCQMLLRQFKIIYTRRTRK